MVDFFMGNRGVKPSGVRSEGEGERGWVGKSTQDPEALRPEGDAKLGEGPEKGDPAGKKRGCPFLITFG